MTENAGPKLLSGGNPQIPKGEGDGPVQDYIAAMPGWKRTVGERLDDLIVRTVPEVHKAVKWNQPFYGLEGEGWFLSFRCYTKYVTLQFFRGTSLDPVPPKPSKHNEVRYLDITRTTTWTKTNSGPGSSRPAICRARRCDAARDAVRSPASRNQPRRQPQGAHAGVVIGFRVARVRRRQHLRPERQRAVQCGRPCLASRAFGGTD